MTFTYYVLAPQDSEEHWTIVCREFLRALQVKDMTTDGGLPPVLDAIWHECILNTRFYHALCLKLRGAFIHHTTSSEYDSDIQRISRIDHTVINYRKRFREEPEYDVWEQTEFMIHGEYEIFVKNLSGATLTFRPSLDTTILEIKQSIEKTYGIQISDQRFIYGGKNLDDNALCRSVVPQYGTVNLVGRITGC